MFGGPAVAQKNKVHQNAPFLEIKIPKNFPRGIPQECFPDPAVAVDGPALYL